MRNLWRTSKTPLIKVTFYPDGTYKITNRTVLIFTAGRLISFAELSARRYKDYCESSNTSFKISTLALIQMNWWELCCYLKSSNVIKDSKEVKMEFVEPKKSVYGVLGGLDEESCM